MTASSETKETSSTPQEELHTLPKALELIQYSFAFTKRYANDLYGFAGYLLLPIILAFAARDTGGALGDALRSISSILFILIACWVNAVIIILVSMRATQPTKQPDPRSVGTYATSILGTLTLATLLAGIIQLAGYILVIPGIIFSILFVFVGQEVVLHGAGPLSALAASRTRVQPKFFAVGWRAIAITLSFFGMYMFLAIGILLVAGAAFSVEPLVLALSAPPWLDAVLAVLQISILPPIIVGITMLYLAINAQEPQESKI